MNNAEGDLPILRHRLLADTQNETPHDIDHFYCCPNKRDCPDLTKMFPSLVCICNHI